MANSLAQKICFQHRHDAGCDANVTRCASTKQDFVQAQIKGKMFERSFHPDPQIYLANQDIVFGAPKIPAIAAALSAAVRLKEPDRAMA